MTYLKYKVGDKVKFSYISKLDFIKYQTDKGRLVNESDYIDFLNSDIKDLIFTIGDRIDNVSYPYKMTNKRITETGKLIITERVVSECEIKLINKKQKLYKK